MFGSRLWRRTAYPLKNSRKMGMCCGEISSERVQCMGRFVGWILNDLDFDLDRTKENEHLDDCDFLSKKRAHLFSRTGSSFDDGTITFLPFRYKFITVW